MPHSTLRGLHPALHVGKRGSLQQEYKGPQAGMGVPVLEAGRAGATGLQDKPHSIGPWPRGRPV